jgi:hypothetical protein
MFQEIERFSEYHLNCTLGARLDIRFAENKNILDRYPNQIEPIVPSVVFLAKSDKILKERKCLEELVSHVPETKQKNWINHISSDDGNLASIGHIIGGDNLPSISVATVSGSLPGRPEGSSEFPPGRPRFIF